MTTAEHILDPDGSQSTGKFMQMLLIAAIAASAISMVFSIGTAVASASDQTPPSVAVDK